MLITTRIAGGTHTTLRPWRRPVIVASATWSAETESGAAFKPSVIFVCTKPGRTINTCTPVPAKPAASPW